MHSRRNGEIRRSVMSVLAVLTAAVLPSLASSPALADDAPATTDTVAAGQARADKRAEEASHAAKKPEDAKDAKPKRRRPRAPHRRARSSPAVAGATSRRPAASARRSRSTAAGWRARA